MIEWTCMSSSEDSPIKRKTNIPFQEKYLLDLPEAPDFKSYPPKISVADNILICEKMLAVWNKKRFSEPHFEMTSPIAEQFYL